MAPTTATLYNLSDPAFNSQTNNMLDNEPYLDTVYNGVDITASKRFSHRWQMVAGLTLGKNTGGLKAGTAAASRARNDLNDPNFLTFSNGIVGNDSPVAFRLSGSYSAPWDILVAGTFIANSGYPVRVDVLRDAREFPASARRTAAPVCSHTDGVPQRSRRRAAAAGHGSSTCASRARSSSAGDARSCRRSTCST